MLAGWGGFRIVAVAGVGCFSVEGRWIWAGGELG